MQVFSILEACKTSGQQSVGQKKLGMRTFSTDGGVSLLMPSRNTLNIKLLYL
jgi:hypothetical protein